MLPPYIHGARCCVLLAKRGTLASQDRLGCDPGIIGRQIRLDGETYTMVGVMAPEFQRR